LKYKKDKSGLGDIITTASNFIKSKNWPVDLVVSVPPSRKGRGFQPVPIVAEGIATDLGIAFYANCVVKVKNTPELKDIFDFEKRLCILGYPLDSSGHNI
jgi:predicted amidophosphoribosyltransferase